MSVIGPESAAVDKEEETIDIRFKADAVDGAFALGLNRVETVVVGVVTWEALSVADFDCHVLGELTQYLLWVL